MKSFPAPLSPSEEKYYIQKYTEGDLEAKHILIEHNLRLVAHVIKKYQNLEEDPEDLISIGTIGLIKAVVTFNPDKGNRLAAYASRCVEKATPSVWLHFAIKSLKAVFQNDCPFQYATTHHLFYFFPAVSRIPCTIFIFSSSGIFSLLRYEYMYSPCRTAICSFKLPTARLSFG